MSLSPKAENALKKYLGKYCWLDPDPTTITDINIRQIGSEHTESGTYWPGETRIEFKYLHTTKKGNKVSRKGYESIDEYEMYDFMNKFVELL